MKGRGKENLVLRLFVSMLQILWLIGSGMSLYFFSYEIAIRRGFFPERFDPFLMTFWSIVSVMGGIILITIVLFSIRAVFTREFWTKKAIRY